MSRFAILPLLSLDLSGCLPVVPPKPEPAALVTPAAALAWESGHPERREWSAALRAAIAAQLASFDTAADFAGFCPSYAGLTPDQRTEVIATLAVAIAFRESGYKPGTVFAEPPPLGVDSIGLFQLSYEDGFSWCDLDRARDTLKDPLNNIACAVPKMARLVAKDRLFAAGSTGSDARGLSRYWSVVRSGPTHFKDEILGKAAALPACQAG